MTTKDLASLALELRRELARGERTLGADASSDERDDLLYALQRIDDGSYGICASCARPSSSNADTFRGSRSTALSNSSSDSA